MESLFFVITKQPWTIWKFTLKSLYAPPELHSNHERTKHRHRQMLYASNLCNAVKKMLFFIHAF